MKIFIYIVSILKLFIIYVCLIVNIIEILISKPKDFNTATVISIIDENCFNFVTIIINLLVIN